MIKRLYFLILATAIAFVAHSQNIGIGTTTPNFPLSFPNTLGDKISLWGTSGNHYGFGVQSLTLQIHTDLSTADIAFGYGASSAFNENMRLKGTGNLGIGTPNPGAKLHIASGLSGYSGGYFPGMVIEGNTNTYVNLLTPNTNETGILFGTASNAANGGIIYNNSTNPNGLQFRINGNTTKVVIDNAGRVGIGNTSPNAPLTFPPTLEKKITLYPGATGDVGFGVAGNRLQIYSDNPNADVAIGYDAAGTFNERFAVKPNGALALTGNTGQAGQVLQSNGSGSGANWTSISNWLYNNVYQMSQTTNNVDIPQNGTFNTIPTMDVGNFSLTINGPAKLLLCLSSTITTNNCFGCGGANLQIGSYIYKNGSAQTSQVLAGSWVGNGSIIEVTSGVQMFNVTAGTYTFKTQAINNGGQDFFVSFSTLFIVAIPQ